VVAAVLDLRNLADPLKEARRAAGAAIVAGLLAAVFLVRVARISADDGDELDVQMRELATHDLVVVGGLGRCRMTPDMVWLTAVVKVVRVDDNPHDSLNRAQ
jgi:hypothetical protein